MGPSAGRVGSRQTAEWDSETGARGSDGEADGERRAESGKAGNLERDGRGGPRRDRDSGTSRNGDTQRQREKRGEVTPKGPGRLRRQRGPETHTPRDPNRGCTGETEAEGPRR